MWLVYLVEGVLIHVGLGDERSENIATNRIEKTESKVAGTA